MTKFFPNKYDQFQILGRFAFPPLLVIFGFAMLILTASEPASLKIAVNYGSSLLSTCVSEQPCIGMYSGSLFIWLGVTFCVIIIAIFTLCYSAKIVYDRLCGMELWISGILICCVYALWAYYLVTPSNDVSNISRAFNFDVSYNLIEHRFAGLFEGYVRAIRIIAKTAMWIVTPTVIASLLAAVVATSRIESPYDVKDLHNRAVALKILLMSGVGMLTGAVLHLMAWLSIPADFFVAGAGQVDKAKAFVTYLDSVSRGFAFAWGAGFSVVAVVAYVPMFIEIKSHCLRAAESENRDYNFVEKEKWLLEQNITFINPAGLREIATMLAPLLAAPLGTVLKSLPLL